MRLAADVEGIAIKQEKRGEKEERRRKREALLRKGWGRKEEWLYAGKKSDILEKTEKVTLQYGGKYAADTEWIYD